MGGGRVQSSFLGSIPLISRPLLNTLTTAKRPCFKFSVVYSAIRFLSPLAGFSVAASSNHKIQSLNCLTFKESGNGDFVSFLSQMILLFHATFLIVAKNGLVVSV